MPYISQQSDLPDLSSGGNLTDMEAPSMAPPAPAPFLPSLSAPSQGSGIGAYEEKKKQKGKDDLPSYESGPGATMFNYLTMRQFSPPRGLAEEGQITKSMQVQTKYPEALKTALSLIGLHSANNRTGIGLDPEEAKAIWAGSKDAADKMSRVDEAAFRAAMESGNGTITPKQIRMFSNYDGSTTWEILNQDKSVNNKFTLGEFDGQKVFVQGGFDAFAKEMADIKQKKGAPGADQVFDQLRAKFVGGLG